MQKNKAEDNEPSYRLNKYLSMTGISPSRRKADELIKAGKIKIDNKIVTDFSFQINPKKHQVFYDNKPVTFKEQFYYVLLNKPKDYISHKDDAKNRKSSIDLIPYTFSNKLKPSHSLDRNSSGLILYTNNGDLLSILSKFNNKLIKIYQITLSKKISPTLFDSLLNGIQSDSFSFKPDRLELLETHNQIGLQTKTGNEKIILQYLDHFSLRPTQIDRVFFAGFTKLKLPRGKSRLIDEKEIRYLQSEISKFDKK